jgi:sn-glycerol 3-phosphate transport system substrate-binding protein
MGYMRVLVFTLCFTMAAAGLSARKIEVSFWHSLGFNAKEIIEDMTVEYNRTRDDVHVRPIFQGSFDEMQVKMLAAAATGQLPDLAQVQMEFMDSFIENGLIEPIDGELPAQLRGDVPPVLWELVSRNGRTYGVPFAVSADVLFYNQELFVRAGLDPDSPPETWEEMIRMGRMLTKDTDGDGKPDVYGVMFWTYGLYGLAPILHANGGCIFSGDGGRVVLTSKEMVRTVGMIHDLVFVHGIMPGNWSEWDSGQAFLTGKLAMGWFSSSAIAYGERNFPWRLRTAAVPLINGVRAPSLGGSALVNFARTKSNRRVADDLMFWLINKRNTLRLHQNIGFIPVRSSALSSMELKAFLRENPNYAAPIEALEYGRPLPNHPKFYRINQELRKMLQSILLSGADPLDELEKTERKINKLIQ